MMRPVTSIDLDTACTSTLLSLLLDPGRKLVKTTRYRQLHRKMPVSCPAYVVP